MHLGDAGMGFRSQRRTPQAGKLFKISDVRSSVFRRLRFSELFGALGQITIILRQYLAAHIFLDIPAPDDPVATQCRQPFANVAFRRRVGPHAARIIDPDGQIFLQSSVKILRRRQRDLAERNS